MRHGWFAALAVGAAGLAFGAVFAPVRVASGEDAKPAYVGADACKKCHMKQFLSWKKVPMAKAFDLLKPDQAADKKTAANLDPKKDYTKDPKCVKCHTTGYGTPSGYPEVAEGKTWSAEETERAGKMEGVQCEACHGPGSLYGPFKKDKKAYKRSEVVALGLLTPPKAEQCATCHTATDNPTAKPDYKFDFEAEKKKHDKIHESVPLKENHDG